MPIYEFYCADCHTIYSFFSRRIDTNKVPSCPKCGRPELRRQVSMFSLSKARAETGQDDAFADVDESKLGAAMASLAGEMEGLNEEDPRQVAKLMRRLFDASGVNLNDGMQEAIRRMEAGEDPDRIEQDMGDLLEAGDPFAPTRRQTLNDLRRRYLPPAVDETLYDL